jgi:hypothetical protein
VISQTRINGGVLQLMVNQGVSGTDSIFWCAIRPCRTRISVRMSLLLTALTVRLGYLVY